MKAKIHFAKKKRRRTLKRRNENRDLSKGSIKGVGVKLKSYRDQRDRNKLKILNNFNQSLKPLKAIPV